MVTEVEIERDLENWKKWQSAAGGSGGGDGAGSSGGQDDGGMGRDQRLLLGLLDDLMADLKTFSAALNTENFYRFVEDTDRPEMLTMGRLAGSLIATDAMPKLQAFRSDLAANYPLRHHFLFGAGLTGDPLLFKATVAQKWKLPKELQWADPLEIVEFLKRSRENFGLAGKILGSLQEALKEFPGIKTLLEAIDELLSIFKFWSRHIDRQHKLVRLTFRADGFWGEDED